MDLSTTMMPFASKKENKNNDQVLIWQMIVGVCFIFLGLVWCIVKYDTIKQKCQMVYVSIILVVIGIALIAVSAVKLNKRNDD